MNDLSDNLYYNMRNYQLISNQISIILRIFMEMSETDDRNGSQRIRRISHDDAP